MGQSFIKIDKCFDYLCVNAGKEITFDALRQYTSWTVENLDTNISKRIREFLIDTYPRGIAINNRTYKVNRNILNVEKEDFYDLFRQKNQIFSRYAHAKHERVRIYDFYLPLTNENLLRQNLDELFYKDTLHRRLKAINIDELLPIYLKDINESEDQYFERLANQASDLFWGYSISHVSGRYRTSPILTKIEAAQKEGKSYLIDETTAVVKFIFPHEDAKEEYHEKLEKLFQVLFVKAITESTPDEDEIWLLENVGSTILHKYKKVS
jgi:hypothetical protein